MKYAISITRNSLRLPKVGHASNILVAGAVADVFHAHSTKKLTHDDWYRLAIDLIHSKKERVDLTTNASLEFGMFIRNKANNNPLHPFDVTLREVG